MISRDGFDASSSWHIQDGKRGAISLRWVRNEDGVRAQLYQYASLVDRNAKRVDRQFTANEAYDRIIAAVARFLEPRIIEREMSDGLGYLPIRVTELPAEFDPSKLNHGKGRSVEGYAMISDSDPGNILIVTYPTGSHDPSRKAEVIYLEKQGNGFKDVPLTDSMRDAASKHPTSFVRRAIQNVDIEAPAYAA